MLHILLSSIEPNQGQNTCPWAWHCWTPGLVGLWFCLNQYKMNKPRPTHPRLWRQNLNYWLKINLILIALSVYRLKFVFWGRGSFQIKTWILGSFRTAKGDEAIISWLKRSKLLFSIILGLDWIYCGPRSLEQDKSHVSGPNTKQWLDILSLCPWSLDNICDIAESRCNLDWPSVDPALCPIAWAWYHNGWSYQHQTPDTAWPWEETQNIHDEEWSVISDGVMSDDWWARAEDSRGQHREYSDRSQDDIKLHHEIWCGLMIFKQVLWNRSLSASQLANIDHKVLIRWTPCWKINLL